MKTKSLQSLFRTYMLMSVVIKEGRCENKNINDNDKSFIEMRYFGFAAACSYFIFTKYTKSSGICI